MRQKTEFKTREWRNAQCDLWRAKLMAFVREKKQMVERKQPKLIAGLVGNRRSILYVLDMWIHIRAIPCPYVRTKTVFLLMCNASKTQWHRSTGPLRGDDVREIIGLTERKMDSYLVVGN
jgi:hypothetical protein